MDSYRLKQEAYLLPTPAGAFQVVCTPRPGPARDLLLGLLAQEQSTLGTPDRLCHWCGMEQEDDVLELVYRLQNLKLVQGERQPRKAPLGPLEDVLPDLLTPLSGSGRALLADDQGLYIASQGFTHEAAEELAALSADLATLHGRHRSLLRHNLNLPWDAWALSDAAGNSQVGFWPLHIGPVSFVLVIGDLPRFNQPAFRDLAWTLCLRYLDSPG